VNSWKFGIKQGRFKQTYLLALFYLSSFLSMSCFILIGFSWISMLNFDKDNFTTQNWYGPKNVTGWDEMNEIEQAAVTLEF
jgi:hypothetical protein